MLEINVVYKSNLERTLRIDSEFYSKENYKVLDVLDKFETLKLTEVAKVSDGNHMSISDKFTDTGIPYYRGQDIHNFFIEQSSPVCIDELTYKVPQMKRSHLVKGDVLLSIVGTIGGVSLVSTEAPATCNCKLAILRPQTVEGFYLAVFLKTRYGQNQIKKFVRGAVQMGLILEDMDQIYVPIVSPELQKRISSLIQLASEKFENSKMLYEKVNENFLAEINLENFVPNENGINEKSFQESFLTSGRLDAEYYQPKFDHLIEHIYAQNYETLDNLVTIKKSIEPGTENYSENSDGLPFLRVSDFDKFRIGEPEKKLTEEFCYENKELIEKLKPSKETILFTKDGSVGIAHLLRENLDMITSGAVLHLNIKPNQQVIPEYLNLVLNSPIVQMQAERDAGGSIILHWRIEEIKNVLIPIVDVAAQKNLADMARESAELMSQADKLIDTAIKGVEIAIEEGEESAFHYIEGNS
ncbi:restriction endonuclease subunit S [Sediminibacillus albus]|uniref:Type I restriction enzyme, S subunit/type I restriction enzyme M protein n=1 Tax=Sediminibacillus albus TaxID=407036 RepID=A0A1G8WFG7_9BACI|nr:restriction endonuclease subunit S [Sediminibacillus albus]SDJ77099.1 type I restriction enzyme, S subunit/type I restriction enzyme M protein [Sediminibacillus albus]